MKRHQVASAYGKNRHEEIRARKVAGSWDIEFREAIEDGPWNPTELSVGPHGRREHPGQPPAHSDLVPHHVRRFLLGRVVQVVLDDVLLTQPVTTAHGVMEVVIQTVGRLLDASRTAFRKCDDCPDLET